MLANWVPHDRDCFHQFFILDLWLLCKLLRDSNVPQGQGTVVTKIIKLIVHVINCIVIFYVSGIDTLVIDSAILVVALINWGDSLKVLPSSGWQSSSWFLFVVSIPNHLMKWSRQQTFLMTNLTSRETENRLSWISNSKHIRRCRSQVLGRPNKWSASKRTCFHGAVCMMLLMNFGWD